jgi:serine O-acetyltransferase
MSARATLREDVLRYLNQSADHRVAGDTLKSRISAVLSPQLQAVWLYRLSHWLWRAGWRRAGKAVGLFSSVVFKTAISPAAAIGPGLFLPHPPGITFCGCAGRGLTMYSMSVCCPSPDDGWCAARGPQLGNNVTVGAHAVIHGRIRVGSGSRIGYCVVLDKDAPAHALVVSRAIRVAVARHTASS